MLGKGGCREETVEWAGASPGPPFPKWVCQRLVEEREQISEEASVGLWYKSASPPWPSYGSPSGPGCALRPQTLHRNSKESIHLY